MRFFSRVILPLIMFVYVGIETYLKIQKSSMCSSTGCTLAEELLRYSSLYLNYFGMIGGVAIAIFGYLSLRKDRDNSLREVLFFVTLYSAIAFESIMIGYQIIANPEPCSFCMGVYAQLLLIALLSSWRYLLYAVPAIVALFISLASLAVPQNRAIITTDGNYLIYSKSCPHCENVKSYFKKSSIAYTPLSIKDVNTRVLIKQLGITQVPVLVIRQQNSTQILKGDHSIIEHFEHSTPPANSSTSDTEKGSIYDSSDNGGCEASIFAEPSCADDTPKH